MYKFKWSVSVDYTNSPGIGIMTNSEEEAEVIIDRWKNAVLKGEKFLEVLSATGMRGCLLVSSINGMFVNDQDMNDVMKYEQAMRDKRLGQRFDMEPGVSPEDE